MACSFFFLSLSINTVHTSTLIIIADKKELVMWFSGTGRSRLVSLSKVSLLVSQKDNQPSSSSSLLLLLLSEGQKEEEAEAEEEEEVRLEASPRHVCGKPCLTWCVE